MDCIITNGGQFITSRKTSVSFPQFSEALEYILQNYSGRKSELVIDDYVREKRKSELEDKLRGTKVKLVK